MFSIDGESGWITTTQEADCEAAGVYRFSVVATDHGSSVKLSSSVLVEVRVTDENDNPPTFSDDLYRGSVVENSSPGEVIVSMTTADADVSLENRLVTCYITGEPPPGSSSGFRITEELAVIAEETSALVAETMLHLSAPRCESPVHTVIHL